MDAHTATISIPAIDVLTVVLALALAADLLFAPWFHIGGEGFALNLAAIKAPKASLGIAAASLAGATVLGILLDQVLWKDRRFFATLAATAALVLVVLKFALPPEHHLKYFGGGFWGAAVLAIALVVALFWRPYITENYRH